MDMTTGTSFSPARSLDPGANLFYDELLSSLYTTGSEIETQEPHRQVVPNVAVEVTQIDDNRMVNSELPSLTPPVHIKRRKPESKAWKFFEKVREADGVEWAVCRHCGRKYKASSKKAGTSNLLKHMEKCPNKRNVDGHRPSEMSGIASSSSPIPIINREETESFGQERSCIRIAEMIIKNRHPLSMVKKVFSENSENNLQSTLSSLKADMVHIYEEEKGKLLERIRKCSSSGRFSLTINLLRRDTFTMYCCLSLHFIDDEWKLNNKVIAFKKVGFIGNYWELFGTFKNMLLDWNLSKNVGFITAQNTGEANQIVSETGKWLARQDALPVNEKLLHVNCFVDTINLLVNVGLDVAGDILFKIMRCVSHVNSSPESNQMFRKAVDLARFQGSKVTAEDMLPIWKFNFKILEMVLGLRNVFFILKMIDPNFSLNPETEEWDKATQIYCYLKVLDEAVGSFSLGRHVTTNVYFPLVCNIYRKLIQWAGESVDRDVHWMACKMKEKFHDYWRNCNEFLAVAAVLDPRFKFDIVESWYKEIYGRNAETHCTKTKATLTDVYNKYVASATACLSGDATSSTSYVTDHYDMLDSLGMPCLSSQDAGDQQLQKSELERYLEESKFRSVKDFDLLGWWRVNTPNYPILAKMARDFLAIPVLAAQSNPSFSDGFKKIDPTTTNLDPGILEVLMCTKDWLQEPEGIDMASERSRG